MREVLLLLSAIVTAHLYAASFVFLLKPVAERFRRARLLSYIFYLAAVTGNAGLILYNYFINLSGAGEGYVPFVSVYQLMVFIAFFFFPARLLLEKGCGVSEAGLFAAAGGALVMTAVCFMPINAVWEFRPALRSPFFIPHILCYVIAYALSFTAMLTVIYGYIRKKDTSDVSALCARILFPFLTGGLFMGAIWADQIWGNFWSWDLKESWSLVTWLTYMLALHLYRRAKLKKAANVLVILGFLFVILTFFFSKLFPGVNSMHAYN